MTLVYLWRERKRHPFASRAWLKSWAKRVYNAGPLMALCWRQYRLRAQGAEVGALTVVTARVNGRLKNLHIGKETSISDAFIVTHAPVTIGDRVTINDDVTILTASHDLTDPNWRIFGKPVQIDDYAWIAQGSMIMPGVHIGRGAVVGAGAVVGRDVAPNTVVAGNPARPTERKRIEELDYCPVAYLAAYEAWLERPTWDRHGRVKEQ
jgi:acetyltransferase-like isoleucine patch superfamily enzyme